MQIGGNMKKTLIPLVLISLNLVSGQIHECAQNHDMGGILSELHNGTEIDSRNEDGETALMIACAENNNHIVRELIRLGANMDAQDTNGSTPLMIAIENNQLGNVLTLIFSNANRNLADYAGETPLLKSISTNNSIYTDLLLQYNVDVTSTNYAGETTLMKAASLGLLNHVRNLITHAAFKPNYFSFINAQDICKTTALLYAIESSHEDIAIILLQYGADPNICDDLGKTPLMEAADQGLDDLIDQLIIYGANINAKDKFGRTALKYSINTPNSDDNPNTSFRLMQMGAI